MYNFSTFKLFIINNAKMIRVFEVNVQTKKNRVTELNKYLDYIYSYRYFFSRNIRVIYLFKQKTNT